MCQPTLEGDDRAYAERQHDEGDEHFDEGIAFQRIGYVTNIHIGFLSYCLKNPGQSMSLECVPLNLVSC